MHWFSIFLFKQKGTQLFRIIPFSPKAHHPFLIAILVSENFNNAEIELRNKKELKKNLNFNPINILSIIYKNFIKVSTTGLQSALDSAQSKQQDGFRNGSSTLNHIQTVRDQLTE